MAAVGRQAGKTQAILDEAAALDQRRQAQIANQLAGINRILGILMKVHAIVNEPLPPVGDWQDRHDEIRDLVVTQLADPPAVRFAIEEGGRLYYVDGALAEKDGALVIMLKPVQ